LKDNRELRLKVLELAVDENRFERLSNGRTVGQTDERHHYRNGIPGKWRTKFSEIHKIWFKNNHPHLLEKTGYENTSDW
jgi:hypothetical protein